MIGHPVLLVRADASSQIGTGHVMRCLALAQKWRSTGGRVIFAQAVVSPPIEERLQHEQIEMVRLPAAIGSPDDAQATVEYAKRTGASWVVADGYEFGPAWQKRIKDAGLRLLLLDDYGHAARYHADLVLNHNAGASRGFYPQCDPTTRLLLGTRFALLRREFLAHRDSVRAIGASRRVLVTMGGGDPANVTGRVIQALREVPELEVAIVVGGSNPNLAAIQAAVDEHRARFRVLVNTTAMPELMAWADVAISAAGSTCWELAFMGLPAALIVLADNQRAIGQELARVGMARLLGEHDEVTTEGIAAVVHSLLSDRLLRSSMAARGRELVDGHGASRVIARMRASEIALRRASSEDCRTLWQWANEPQVRASAFSSSAIAWDDHCRWFERKIAEQSTAIFIGTDAAGRPIGQARFECAEPDTAEIDVCVDPQLRHAGLGAALICRAVDELFASRPIGTVAAHIKPENHSSLHAFANAGFVLAGKACVRGHDAVRLIRTNFND